MADAAAETAAFVALATRSGAMGRAVAMLPDNTAPDPATLQWTHSNTTLTPSKWNDE